MLLMEHSAILSTFIKLPFVIKSVVIVLSIFEWPFYTGFTVCIILYFLVWYFLSILVPMLKFFKTTIMKGSALPSLKRNRYGI